MVFWLPGSGCIAELTAQFGAPAPHILTCMPKDPDGGVVGFSSSLVSPNPDSNTSQLFVSAADDGEVVDLPGVPPLPPSAPVLSDALP